MFLLAGPVDAELDVSLARPDFELILVVLVAGLVEVELNIFEVGSVLPDFELFIVAVSLSSSSSSFSSSFCKSCADSSTTSRSSAMTPGSGKSTLRSVCKVLRLLMAHLKAFITRLMRPRSLSRSRFLLVTQGVPVSMPPLSLKASSKSALTVPRALRAEVFDGGLTMLGPT